MSVELRNHILLPAKGGGKIGELLRSEAASEFIRGGLSQWPQSLHGAIALLLDSPLPMVIAWGPDLRLLYNDSYAEILGPRHPAALCAPAEPEWVGGWLNRGVVARVLGDETVVSENIKVGVETLEDPAFRWFTVSLSPLRHSDGRVGGIIGVGIDTTAAVLSADLLLSERNRIRDLFQQAPGFMAMGTGPDHVLEFANDAFFSLVGDRELIGKTVRDALPELEGQGFFELLDQAYASGKPFVGREVPIMLARQGTEELEQRYIDTVYQPIKQDGEVVGILAEGYDVTEQKRTRDQLQQLQSELIHFSRVGAMSAMAATLAHELNQPLTAIKAYVAGAKRLLDNTGDAAIDDVKLALAEAGAASTRAGEIIRRLRVMVERGEPEAEIADLGMVVNEAVSLVSIGAAEEGVSVCREIAAGVIVNIDQVQLQQVVVNLVHNAVEATLEADRREIKVSVRIIRGSALLQVEDSGCGINAADFHSVFSPLFTTKTNGLGIGLSISRTIVEAHRGTISVDASPMGGACLNVRLPLSRTAP